MARKSDRQIVDEITAEWEPRIRDAFLASIDDITSTATLKAIAERLERGDVAGAIEALGLDPGAFGPLDRAIAETYYGGGLATVNNWPLVRGPDGARVVFRFGVRNNAAEAWLAEHSSTLVTRIIEDQREGIRAALQLGLAEGRNPRNTALDIVGRFNRHTGRREGGIVGLTTQQARFVANARAELLSGDPALLRNYLTRAARDKRFDPSVRKAILNEEPVDSTIAGKAVGRYSDGLLKVRGEAIARTETLGALNKARNDAIAQQIMAGKVDQRDVTKVWQAAMDSRTRDTHRVLHNQRVPFAGKFKSPSGAELAYPGDPAAPAGEHISCRCWLRLDVDFLASVVRNSRSAA